MNYSEADIRKIVADVLAGLGSAAVPSECGAACADSFPVEISARHVHLTRDAVEVLFGKGYELHRKKDLSQPGEFLSEERVKLVTQKGQFANVAVLGPVRKAVQVEVSATDAVALGIKAPVNLSGNLSGAGDVLIVGPAGCLQAKGSVIIAKAHVHMTPKDAQHYGVRDGQVVNVKINSARPITVESIVRVRDNMALAMHIDFDEGNAGMVKPGASGCIISSGCTADSCCTPQADSSREYSDPSVLMPQNCGKKLITEQDAKAIRGTGAKTVHLLKNAIVTPSARDVFLGGRIEAIKDL